jgi:type VI secretion system protein ImpM
MPSVDRVGRYFPLSVVAILADRADPIELPVTAADWFHRAEQLVRTALDDAFDFDRFDEQVAALGLPSAGGLQSGRDSGAASASGLRLALVSADAVDDAYRRVAGRFLAASYPRCSLWWTAGSPDVEPTFVACSGLPSPAAFGAFLDGRWDHWGWAGGESGAPVPARAQA